MDKRTFISVSLIWLLSIVVMLVLWEYFGGLNSNNPNPPPEALWLFVLPIVLSTFLFVFIPLALKTRCTFCGQYLALKDGRPIVTGQHVEYGQEVVPAPMPFIGNGEAWNPQNPGNPTFYNNFTMGIMPVVRPTQKTVTNYLYPQYCKFCGKVVYKDRPV